MQTPSDQLSKVLIDDQHPFLSKKKRAAVSTLAFEYLFALVHVCGRASLHWAVLLLHLEFGGGSLLDEMACLGECGEWDSLLTAA
jgi:hypothetical protein